MSGQGIKLLESLIDYSALRNKVISKNIANIETNGYKREDVDFKDILNSNMRVKLKSSDPEHIKGTDTTNNNSGFKIVEDKNSPSNGGKNNVDIDKEMAALAENTLLYKFASKKLGDYYKTLQNVISGGGKG